ncbi:MAG: hypothetical protein KJ558_10095 [Gammaproteobacteria bacterium]|nr:hypothetical protein [Gammaproteobacteria bacterium]MBU1655157.1 hypothetical protein [Gammaproteobacteria bacterium]MBU1959968.1 hypothetical protein [Gammaproteobacteria bacterium]
MSPVKIPLVIGRNRLRGKATGAMVDESDGNHLHRLRAILREEAKASGVEPDEPWLNRAVAQLLRLCEQAEAGWAADKGGTIGHVFEACLPSGRALLMGDARVLALVSDK